MKAILISIKPKHCCNILNLIKTIEVRKTATKEWKEYLSGKTDKVPEPIECFIYCTKDSGYLLTKEQKENNYRVNWFTSHSSNILNGKVVAKFTLNKVEEIRWKRDNTARLSPFTDTLGIVKFNRASCLDTTKVLKYLEHKTGYAWHISNLEIFDKPRELYEIHKPLGSYDCNHDCVGGCNMCWCKGWETRFHFECEIQKAPQSWCYVETGEELL